MFFWNPFRQKSDEEKKARVLARAEKLEAKTRKQQEEREKEDRKLIASNPHIVNQYNIRDFMEGVIRKPAADGMSSNDEGSALEVHGNPESVDDEKSFVSNRRSVVSGISGNFLPSLASTTDGTKKNKEGDSRREVTTDDGDDYPVIDQERYKPRPFPRQESTERPIVSPPVSPVLSASGSFGFSPPPSVLSPVGSFRLNSGHLHPRGAAQNSAHESEGVLEACDGQGSERGSLNRTQETSGSQSSSFVDDHRDSSVDASNEFEIGRGLGGAAGPDATQIEGPGRQARMSNSQERSVTLFDKGFTAQLCELDNDGNERVIHSANNPVQLGPYGNEAFNDSGIFMLEEDGYGSVKSSRCTSPVGSFLDPSVPSKMSSHHVSSQPATCASVNPSYV